MHHRCAGESKRLVDAIQALQLETSSVARGLKDTIAARERQLVEHDVLKLQVWVGWVCSLGVSRMQCGSCNLWPLTQHLLSDSLSPALRA
jgi:hypothetical protein